MSDLFIDIGCGGGACADLVISGGDLLRGNDLSTALEMSLFTDARARQSDIIPSGTDPRGWWGSALDNDEFGSLLWLLESSNATPDLLRKAKQYATQSINWLLVDGVVSSFEVDTNYQGCCGNVLAIEIEACMPDGRNIRWRWRYAWDLKMVQECEYRAQVC